MCSRLYVVSNKIISRSFGHPVFGRMVLVLMCLLFYGSAKAQSYFIFGRVTDNYTKLPVTGLHVFVNGRESESFTDLEGNFRVAHNPVKSLRFKGDIYRDLVVENPVNNGPFLDLVIKLTRTFEFETESNAEGITVMEKVFDRRFANNPVNKRPFRCNIYDKLVIYTDSLERARSLVNSTLQIFGKKHKLNPFKGDHNIFTLETSSRRLYKNALHRRETIAGLRASGIEEFSATAPLSRMQSFSVYDNYVIINSAQYISPLAGNPLIRYVFTVLDTAYTGTDTLYVVKFNPRKGHYVQTLKGYMHINTKGYAVQYIQAVPVSMNNLNERFTQTYTRYNGSDWFPAETQGEFTFDNFLNRHITITGRQKSYYSKVKFREKMNASDFSDVVLDFDSAAGARDSIYWSTNRFAPLSLRDSNTFAFYNMQGKLRNFGYIVNIGERLYEGQLNFNKIGIDLDRVLSFNYYENFRLGMGAHSNYLLNNRLRVGGYYGYGFRDKRNKYGFDAAYNLFPKYVFTPGFNYSNDLAEPGGQQFYAEKKMYGSELLRNYQFPRLDIAVREELFTTMQPFRNIHLKLGAAHTLKFPKYYYVFSGTPAHAYEFFELTAAARISIGERFARLRLDKISLGTSFPEVWLQFTKGQKNLFGGDFDYRKYEAKINWRFRILGTGQSGVQLVAGLANGTLPYLALFNGRGSYREASFVTFNAFETMRYNEFASDRYTYLFLTHNFLPIYIPGYPFQPYFTLMQNMGIGSISNPSAHALDKTMSVKSLEKGYAETGLFINDGYVFNFFGLKAGLGIGLFYRYGANRMPKTADNVITKFALTFSI